MVFGKLSWYNNIIFKQNNPDGGFIYERNFSGKNGKSGDSIGEERG
ncbi:MAG: hypothetical protein BWY64_03672 [bacterium ADurb.Bin363]|nr:MAG: hypothetical protein BWY64_03672 [bacterium ADurb.Bin363]